MPIKITKHARLKPEIEDGIRILVTRYWLRNLKKENIDRWLKQLGPSKGLLKEYLDFDALRVGENDRAEFHEAWSDRYREEMRDQRTVIAKLRHTHEGGKTVTLLCACHDEKFCHRKILKDLIEDPDF